MMMTLTRTPTLAKTTAVIMKVTTSTITKITNIY